MLIYDNPVLSVYSRDGRLQENDQILAIDGQVLESNISHPQAITILQQASGRVELIVARGSPVVLPLGSPSPLSKQSSVQERTPSVSDTSDMVVSYATAWWHWFLNNCIITQLHVSTASAIINVSMMCLGY